MNFLSNFMASFHDAHFARPEFLWLLIPAALVVLGFAVLKKDNFSVLMVRLLSISLLVLSLADPVRQETSSEQEMTALVDISASIQPAGREALLRSLHNFLSKSDFSSLSLLPFGRNPAKDLVHLEGNPSFSELAKAVERASSELDSGDTNIAGAMSAVISRSGAASALLLSDGFSTSGDYRQAATLAAAKGMSVFPLVPDEAAFLNRHLSIAALEAPVTMSSGELTSVRITTRNNDSTPRGGSLEIWLEEKKLYSQSIEVEPNQEKVFQIKTPALEGGLKRVRAVLKPDDSLSSQPEEKHRWISVKNRSKLLLVNGSAEDARILKDLLGESGYTIENIILDGNSTLPTSFQDYTSVILNNASKKQLTPAFISGLKDFVNSGGGLALVGGDRSFGLGGYIDTPIEEMSPVKFVPPQTVKRRLNTAVILVIDKSRSMQQEGKIEGAKAAALASIESLKPDDLVGVTAFDDSPFVIIALQPVPQARLNAGNRLRNLVPSLHTNMLPAIQSARMELSETQASRKHIIILSDGDNTNPNQNPGCVRLVEQLRQEGITVSAVVVGYEANNPFMQQLAASGRGAFYSVLDPQTLPQIFQKDIKVTTGEELTMKEQQDYAVQPGPDGISSTTVSRYPVLRGFVETQPKRNAKFELVTYKDDKPFPILASWDFGQGRVVAFTSDANGRWSAPWVRWPEFAKFWGQIAETIKNKTNTKTGDVDFDLRYSVQGKNVVFDLSLFDDRLATQAAPKISAQVYQPGGENQQIIFSPAAKGRFLANLGNGAPGDYRMEISYGSVKLPPLAVTIGGEAFGEKVGAGINVQTLSDIAHLSGGILNPDPAQVKGKTRTQETVEHLFPPLVLLAFLLVLIEAFLREIGLAQLLLMVFLPFSAARRDPRNHPKKRPVGRYNTATR